MKEMSSCDNHHHQEHTAYPDIRCTTDIPPRLPGKSYRTSPQGSNLKELVAAKTKATGDLTTLWSPLTPCSLNCTFWNLTTTVKSPTHQKRAVIYVDSNRLSSQSISKHEKQFDKQSLTDAAQRNHISWCTIITAIEIITENKIKTIQTEKPHSILGTQWSKWWVKFTLQLLPTLSSYVPCLHPHLPAEGSLLSSLSPATLPAIIRPPPFLAFTKTVMWKTAVTSTKGLQAYWEARWRTAWEKVELIYEVVVEEPKQGSHRNFAGTAVCRFRN